MKFKTDIRNLKSLEEDISKSVTKFEIVISSSGTNKLNTKSNNNKNRKANYQSNCNNNDYLDKDNYQTYENNLNTLSAMSTESSTKKQLNFNMENEFATEESTKGQVSKFHTYDFFDFDSKHKIEIFENCNYLF